MAIETVRLHDKASGSEATILAGFGFNCYSLRLVSRGEPVELLWSAPDFAQGGGRPSHSGIPILFPFPGRIGGTQFKFRGQSYPLEAADGRGNAIHGFVLNRAWEVVEKSARHVVGRFQASQVDPHLALHWPADFRLTVRYDLEATRLISKIEIHNPDNKPLPWGLGTHPYFRLPLGKQGQAADCRVTVPAAEYWELVEMLASGKRLPADGPKGLRQTMRFEDTKLDDVFSGLSFDAQGRCTTTIDDAANRRRLVLRFDRTFMACVVYNPPHREAICLEPYTCVPDAFRLEEQGFSAGARVLEPGQSVNCEVEIGLEELT